MNRIITSTLCVFALLLSCATAPGQTNPRQPYAFLQKYFGFSKADLEAIDQGKIVTRLPKTSVQTEVVALGVVRLNVSKEFFLEKFRGIESFKKSEFVSQIRKFSSPPRLEDLNELTLEAEHLSALKKCKVGDSDVKMSAEWIERFRRINWSAPDHTERGTALARQLLLDYVLGYLKKGNAALVEYNDGPVQRRLADEVRSLLEQSPYLGETAPAFHKYLVEFPRMQLPGAQDFVYWSKERVGNFKTVLGLTHVTVYEPKTESPSQIVIASKQIYANHYFEGSLALTWVVDAQADSRKKGCYLIYLNRSRMDVLRGGFSWLKRYVARGRIRDGLMQNIRLTKDRLEAAVDGLENAKLSGCLEKAN